MPPTRVPRFGYREGDFPIAERAAKTVLTLPFHTNMPEPDIAYVVTCLKGAIEQSGR